MFGISLSELFLIIVIFIIFLGPERVPEVIRTIVKTINELKGVGREFRESVTRLETKQSDSPSANNNGGAGKDKEGKPPSP